MSNSVGGFTNFDDSATLDDGKFHVTIVPSLDIFRFIFYLPRIMRGKFYTIPGITYFTAKRMKIQAQEKSVGTRTDGDKRINSLFTKERRKSLEIVVNRKLEEE